MNGYINVKYVAGVFGLTAIAQSLDGMPDLATWMDRDYGVAFEAPLAALEMLWGYDLEATREVFHFRHLVTFLFCALGPLAIWGTVWLRYRSAWIALAGAVLFVASPRLFAESFYNSKDMVFLTAFAVAIFTMTAFLTRPTIGWAALHGFATAFAMDVRIMGIVLLVGTLFVLGTRIIKQELPALQGMTVASLYLIAAIVFTIALFPFLWEAPMENFKTVFANMSKFRWDGETLFQGQMISVFELPWYYIPVWVAITIPMLSLAAFLLGALTTLRQLGLSHVRLWRSEAEMLDLIFLGCATLPVVAVVLFDSVLYDGWRQLYYIYAGIVLTAVRGGVALERCVRESRGMKIALGCVFVANIIWAFGWMITSHPLQNVYVNVLAGKDAHLRYERDYWGLSTAEALKWIVDQDQRKVITVSMMTPLPLNNHLDIVPNEVRARILAMGRSKKGNFYEDPRSDYVINYFRRLEPEDINVVPDEFSLTYERRVGGIPVYRIFRRNQAPENVSISTEPYTKEDLEDVSYFFSKLTIDEDGEHKVARVRLAVSKDYAPAISALTTTYHHINVSWRLIDRDGKPKTGFDMRKPLFHDITPSGRSEVEIVSEFSPSDSAIEISVVQEGLFWLHDIGVAPLVVKLP